MSTCTVCGGRGWTEGGYPACYSCSGSGTGGFTNIACAACSGSGRGSIRETNVCIGCGGMGQVPGSQSAYSRTTASSRRGSRVAPSGGSKQQSRPWTRKEVIALLPVTAVVAWVLFEQYAISGWWLVGASILAAAIIVRAWKGIVALGVLGALAWFFLIDH
jgi:hypothetical protein